MSIFSGERIFPGPTVIQDDGSGGKPLTVIDQAGTVLYTIDNVGAVAPTGNMTIAASKTLAVTTADKLTIGGRIIGSTFFVTADLKAASVDNWAFIAPVACKVVSVKEAHAVVGGSSAAVSPRKVTGVSAPGAAVAAGITEITTAAFDLTATANTVVTGTLSATATDYTFAAGDKLGLDFSGTLTGLVGLMTVEFVRV